MTRSRRRAEAVTFGLAVSIVAAVGVAAGAEFFCSTPDKETDPLSGQVVHLKGAFHPAREAFWLAASAAVGISAGLSAALWRWTAPTSV